MTAAGGPARGERAAPPGAAAGGRWRAPPGAEVLVAGLYAAAAALATWQQLDAGHVNNFLMFRWSFQHLREAADLYAAYPALYADRFQYGPSFALLMAPFALPPVWAGLLLFNALNVGVFYAAVRRLLPGALGRTGLLLLLFEVLRTTQNSETNALVAGLMILAFVWLEEGRLGRAAFAIAAGAAIKLFPLAAAALAVMHRRRVRFGLLLAAALAALAVAPLLLTDPADLLRQYRGWGAIEHGYRALRLESVMAVLGLAVPGGWPNWPVQAAGAALLLLPLWVRRADWGDAAFRRAMLCSVLAWVVLFNHQAESPTFVVAMAGVVAWYLTGPRRWHHRALMALAWILVSLSSEVVPPRVLNACCRPWHYKTVPVLLAWLVMQWELLRPPPRGAPAAA